VGEGGLVEKVGGLVGARLFGAGGLVESAGGGKANFSALEVGVSWWAAKNALTELRESLLLWAKRLDCRCGVIGSSSGGGGSSSSRSSSSYVSSGMDDGGGGGDSSLLCSPSCSTSNFSSCGLPRVLEGVGGMIFTAVALGSVIGAGVLTISSA